MTAQPHATERQSDLSGWARFWLWALAGAGLVLGFVSLGLLLLLPAVVFVVVLARRSRNDGRALLGMVSGAGLPLLFVAGLNWNDWQHRVAGDGTPNPYYWGGVGLILLAAGVVAFAVRRNRSS